MRAHEVAERAHLKQIVPLKQIAQGHGSKKGSEVIWDSMNPWKVHCAGAWDPTAMMFFTVSHECTRDSGVPSSLTWQLPAASLP